MNLPRCASQAAQAREEPAQPYPAVVVHGLDHARIVLRLGAPVTLLSAPGAALSLGCLWWRHLVDTARGEYPATPALDILDCADAPGFAMAALRIGQKRLVLWPSCPAFAAVSAAAAPRGAEILPVAPQAWDLSRRDGMWRLPDYVLNGRLS